MTSETNEITAQIYVAWTDRYYALGVDQDTAQEELFNLIDDTDLYRVARFEVQLPAPYVEDGGKLTLTGDRPTLRVVK